MLRPHRKLAFCVVAAVLTASCAGRTAEKVAVSAVEVQATPTVTAARDDLREIARAARIRRERTDAAVRFAVAVHNNNVAEWYRRLAENEAAARQAREAAARVEESITAPRPPPPAVSGGGDCEALIRQIWQTAVEWAIGIAHRESGCTAGATSPDGARGVFQLLGHVDDGCAYNMECNIRAAWSLYQQCHEGPWTAPNYGCW